MSMNVKSCKVIAIVNQKGGVGKTTTCANLGIGLANLGNKVLLIDADSQGSLTASLGWHQPDELEDTLATVMGMILSDVAIPDRFAVLYHAEGVDLIPGNIVLASVENTLVNAMCREAILKQYIDTVRNQYDYILIDCMPSLGMLTINALAAADSVIIPVQAQYLPIKGLEQLIKTIAKVKRQINPGLSIDGILITMVDTRPKFTKELLQKLHENYDGKLRIYKNNIPLSVRAAEISAEGKSIYAHDPHGKVAKAYESLTLEVAAG
ncbi:ParA family protein [Caproiciproducens sp. LBM24188]